MRLLHATLLRFFLLIVLILKAIALEAAIESAVGNGNWASGSSWVGGVVPGPGDDVIIKTGHQITLSDTRACAAVLVEANAFLTLSGSLTQSGAFTINGLLTINGGPHTFSANFTGSGTLSINGATTINVPSAFAPALPNINHGAAINVGAATDLTILNGTTWNWVGDFGTNFTSITNDGTLNIGGVANHNTPVNITNNGGKTINWTGGVIDNSGGGQTLINHGTFNLIGNNPNNVFCNMPIVNTGTMNKTAGTLTIVQALDNQVGGTVTLSAGATFTFTTGNLTQNGTFTVNGVLILSGGSHVFNPNLVGTGTLTINNTSTITAPSGFAPALPIVNHSGSSLLNATAATAVTILNGTTWNWVGDFGTNFTSITNNGTLNIAGVANHNTPANITNNAGKTINWSEGVIDNNGGGQTLTNHGIFNLIGNNPNNVFCNMLIVNTGTVNKTTGTLSFLQPFDNQSTGSINGQGTLTFNSTFTNNGLIAPGLSPGIIVLNRAAGIPIHDLAIEVSSDAGPGTGHDRLQSANAISISGGLSVDLLNGFTPAYGAVYSIVTYPSRTGTFTSVTPDCWTVNYGATSTTITYEPDTWYADADGDGFGDASDSQIACEQPSGYVSNSDDCDGSNTAINPAATEICNGIDDDCDGLTDDADPGVSGQSIWYADVDNDGYGNPALSQAACNQPAGYVSNNGDCNDANAAMNPTSVETCNGIDDDCDGLTDEDCNGVTISGTIIWEHNGTSGVKDVLVNLTGDQSGSTVTPVSGVYDFAPTSGSNFTVTPVKNTNKLNGVTVADATRIQQHIVSAPPITNPYKLVAADVNKSNSITTLDAVVVTQALLGNPGAQNLFKTSWRFVPATHTMNNPPWGFPEKIVLTGVNGPVSGQDFYGIKTGDVATVFANPANLSPAAPLDFQLNDQPLTPGATIIVAVRAGQMHDLVALQLGLIFDPEKLILEKIQPVSGFPLTDENFGTHNEAVGELRLVWSQATGLDLEESTPVFQLMFRVLEGSGQLSEALRLAPELLPGLAYTEALQEHPVRLVFQNTSAQNEAIAQNGVVLLQNSPNPFDSRTAIEFVLPESCMAQLRIYDVSGRVVESRSNYFPAGKNREIFELTTAPGVLFYELTTAFGQVTRKMMRLRN